MIDIPALLASLGGPRVVAARVVLTRNALYRWTENGVPARYWLDLVEMAAEAGVAGVSTEALRQDWQERAAARRGRQVPLAQPRQESVCG